MESQAIPKGTIEQEFASASLGDARLTKRLVTVVRGLSKQPDASFPQVFNESGLAGTYRFMNNPRVTPEAILEPHKVQTAERAAEYKEVIVAHDTTEYGFGTNPREGLGYVGQGKTYGFKSHASLVVAPGDMRTPLGVIALQTVNRTKKKRKTKKRSKKGRTKKRGHKELQRAKDNEGRRWLQGIEEARRRLDSKTSAIHVTDREGDAYALMAALCQAKDRFVIRAAYNRRVQKIRGAEIKERDKLRSVLERATVLDSREIVVSRRDASPMPSYRKNFPPRGSRKAIVSIKAVCVTIKRPHSASECETEELTLNLVQVIEENPPEGQPPVEWLLWTTEPIESAENVWKIVDIYRARWLVEICHPYCAPCYRSSIWANGQAYIMLTGICSSQASSARATPPAFWHGTTRKLHGSAHAQATYAGSPLATDFTHELARIGRFAVFCPPPAWLDRPR